MNLVRKLKTVGIIAVLSIALFSCASTFTDTPHDLNRTISSTQPSIDSATFTRELESRMYRIQEFAALREWGTKNGVRVFGAGGTAAGLAVYVKQNLENEALKREGKPLKYFDGRFTYNYFDIFRSTQDADIVIDGNEEDARKLESFLQQNFNYLEGSKSVWEVRLLNQSRGTGAGEKDPLLGFDFQNQNSDSFSTGMIELTDPPRGESKVRDLFDWKNQKDPKFLRDILEGTITFYVNPNHFQTKRAAAGMNPEILSAIRVLTKAFQYEAEITPDDEKELRRIIDKWNPRAEADSYVANQISKNGQKLFWHSPDVERASIVLKDLGLQAKLVEFGKIHGKNDLTTWLSRVPLPTRPLGTVGKTAKELGITIVAHETNSFIAYENISRSLKGKPNVFISRDGAAGEAAVHGDGFYTAIGKKGARGSGLTIRFAVNPDARDGVDFFLHGDFVIVQNSAALKVIDESLNISVVDYFRLLTDGDLSSDDKGVLEKLKIKLRSSTQNLTAKERHEINKLAHAEYAKFGDTKWERPITPFFAAWFDIPHPASEHIFLNEVARLFPAEDLTAIPELAKLPVFPQWMQIDIKKNWHEVGRRLQLPHIVNHPSYETWIGLLINSTPNEAATKALRGPEAIRHEAFPRFFERLYGLSKDLAIALLDQDGLETHPLYDEWMKKLIMHNPEKVTSTLLNTPRINALKTNPHFESWIELIFATSPTENTRKFLYGTFRFLGNDPIYSKWIRMSSEHTGLHAQGFEDWIGAAIDQYPEEVIGSVLTQNIYFDHPAYDTWMKKIIPKVPAKIGISVINWEVNRLGRRPHFAEWVLAVIALDPSFSFHYGFLEKLSESNLAKLQQVCGPGEAINVHCLREGLKKSMKCNDLLH